MNRGSVNVGRMKICVIQSKYGIMINVAMSLKNYVIGVLLKMIICGILVHVIANVIGQVRLTNIWILAIYIFR